MTLFVEHFDTNPLKNFPITYFDGETLQQQQQQYHFPYSYGGCTVYVLWTL